MDIKLNNGEKSKGMARNSAILMKVKPREEWYHFEEDGIMNSGWFLDENTDK